MSVQRVVVVGASTGLGRSIALGLAGRGAKVALLARSEGLLNEAAAEAGPDALAITCDVTNVDSCRQAIDAAAAGLGGIDAVIVAAGIGTLSRIEDVTPEIWMNVFATNVIGASSVTAAALPHLRTSNGMALYLSSMSASLTSPWPGLASYTVTKAALDKLVEAWRAEHSEIGFTRLIVGECSGGEGDAMSRFTASWNPDLAGELFPLWAARGLLTDKLMDVDHFVDVVEGLLRCGSSASIPTVAVTPRRPI